MNIKSKLLSVYYRLRSLISAKADRVGSATAGNFAALDANGNLVDSGHSHSTYLTSHQSLSGYVPTSRTVAGKALSGNVTLNSLNFKNASGTTTVTYNGNGNKDVTAASLGAITAHQDISGKLDKSGGTMSGDLNLDDHAIQFSGSAGAWMASGNDTDEVAINAGQNTLILKVGNGGTVAKTSDIPAAQVQADWNATSGMGVILNKPSNVSSFTNDAGYLTSHQELRYAIVTPTVTTSTTDSADDTISATMQDRAVNVVEAGSGVDYVNLTFPAGEYGYARDFFVRLVLTGDSVPAVSFSEPGGGNVEFDVDDDSWAEIELGVNLLMFTETSQDSGSNS